MTKLAGLCFLDGFAIRGLNKLGIELGSESNTERAVISFKRTQFLILHSIAPLLLGTLIYLLWRPDSLLVFGWLAMINLSGVVADARLIMAGWTAYLPDWLLYTLPGGLWVYAATTGIGAVWLKDWRPEAWLWCAFPLILGSGHEIGQYAGAVSGTFSAMDMIAYLAGAALGMRVLHRNKPKGATHETTIAS